MIQLPLCNKKRWSGLCVRMPIERSAVWSLLREEQWRVKKCTTGNSRCGGAYFHLSRRENSNQIYMYIWFVFVRSFQLIAYLLQVFLKFGCTYAHILYISFLISDTIWLLPCSPLQTCQRKSFSLASSAPSKSWQKRPNLLVIPTTSEIDGNDFRWLTELISRFLLQGGPHAYIPVLIPV